MKLLFSDNTLWGLVNFRLEIFRHFYELGYEIVLVAPYDPNSQLKTSVPDFVKYIPVKLERTGKSPLQDIQYMISLYRIYRSEKPDYIFHYTIKPNIYGSIAAHFAGIRNIAMIAGLGYTFTQTGLIQKIVTMLYRFSLKFAYKIFVLNEENKDILIRMNFTSVSKIILLTGGEGINTRHINETVQDCGNDKTTFLMVARALYDKGYQEFVDAAKILFQDGINADFCLLGPVDNKYPNAVPDSILKKDINSGFIKYLGFSDKPLEIMGLPGTVIVLPSYHEGMNRSLMEACALGKPIITSDIPGCREMVENGKNGFLVPVKNANALAEAMKKYINLDIASKIQMGHNSRQIAERRFDISHVITEYDKIVLSKGL